VEHRPRIFLSRRVSSLAIAADCAIARVHIAGKPRNFASRLHERRPTRRSRKRIARESAGFRCIFRLGDSRTTSDEKEKTGIAEADTMMDVATFRQSDTADIQHRRAIVCRGTDDSPYLFELIQCYRGIRPAWPDVKIRFVSNPGALRCLGVLLALCATMLPRALRSRRASR